MWGFPWQLSVTSRGKSAVNRHILTLRVKIFCFSTCFFPPLAFSIVYILYYDAFVPPEVEKRLSVVIAQEEEVRAIADEHLEREVALKTLLEDLYQESQVWETALMSPGGTLGQAKPRQVKTRQNLSHLRQFIYRSSTGHLQIVHHLDLSMHNLSPHLVLSSSCCPMGPV